MFPSGMFAGPIAVFNENRTFDHWILPVKDDYGMYLGLFVSKYENFSSTGSATKYPEPRHNIFSKTKDEAYSLMLNSSVYSAYQIKEPYVSVVEGKGYHWTSEVVVDGRHVGRLIFAISVIDPSDADNRLKTPA